MRYLSWLTSTIAKRLEDESIGTPVALRLYLQLAEQSGELSTLAAAGLSMAEHWFDDVAVDLYAQGGPEQGQISVLADLSEGQTAMISAEQFRAAHGEAPSLTLLLIGNHGSLEFRDDPESAGVDVDFRPPSDAPVLVLRQIIERSLSTGRREEVVPIAAQQGTRGGHRG